MESFSRFLNFHSKIFVFLSLSSKKMFTAQMPYIRISVGFLRKLMLNIFINEIFSAVEPELCLMIKNAALLKKFENNLKREKKPDFYINLRIVEELHKEALMLKVFAKEPLKGIETDIMIAGVVNSA